MSLKGKAIDFIREAAREENSPRFNSLEMLLINIGERLDALETILRSMDSSLLSLGTTNSERSLQTSEERPLTLSRASWPRMRKRFEERDVLNSLQQERTVNQAWSEQNARTVSQEQSSLFNSEADKVAEYWKNKQG